MHKNPIMYFPFGIFDELSESELTAISEAEIVRINKELIIKEVNFCELNRNEKRALNANCVAQSKEYVETGRYKRPYEYIKLSPVKSRPKNK